jgi:Velvet factor
MIQKLNDRGGTAALTPHRENTSLSVDGPETWGSWYNRRFVLFSESSNLHRSLHSYRFYSLEVAQEPIRARMCGFGDKVRHSLALPVVYSTRELSILLLPGSAPSSSSNRSKISNKKRKPDSCE